MDSSNTSPANKPGYTFPFPSPGNAVPQGALAARGVLSNPEKVSELWRLCLELRHEENDFGGRLRAVLRLLGFIDTPDRLARLANVAWGNGAVAAREQFSLDHLLYYLGNHQPAAEALLEKVWQVKQVAGGNDPWLDQRLILAEALGPQALRSYKTEDGLVKVAAIAGWLAWSQAHLVTARLAAGATPSKFDYIIAGQLQAQFQCQKELISADAFLRWLGWLYGPERKRQCRITMGALQSSLGLARESGWTMQQFLRHAVTQGRLLMRHSVPLAYAILDDTRDLQEQFETRCMVNGDTAMAHMTDDEFWEIAVGTLSPAGEQPTWQAGALETIKDTYDFLLWLGMKREQHRRRLSGYAKALLRVP
jgi:hypothetical protein